MLASPRLRSQSKVKQRSSIDMESLDGRFASIFALIVEHPCIGRPMAGQVHTSLRSAHLLIRTFPRHPYPYTKSQGTPGCSSQRKSNIFGAQLLAAIKARFPPKCSRSSPARAWRLVGTLVHQTNPDGHCAECGLYHFVCPSDPATEIALDGRFGGLHCLRHEHDVVISSP